MKRLLYALLITIAAFVVLVIGIGLVAKAMVGSAGRDKLVSMLQESTGVPISIATADFDLSQLFRLRPALSLTDISIGNPPGFRGKYLLQASSMSAQVELLPLLQKDLRVKSIEVDQPRITIEQNAHGDTNVETLVKRMSSGSKPSGGSKVNLSVDSVAIRGGQITLPAGPTPSEQIPLRDVNISLRNLALDQSCQLEAEATLFNGKQSALKIEGKAGPFGVNALPLDGKLSVTVAPNEIPATMRERDFGKLLGAPGAKGKVTLQAAVRGDLYGILSGPGSLELSDVLIGKDDKHVLPLSGHAPMSFTGSRLMSEPSLQLKLTESQLKLGQGEWRGQGEFQYHASATSGMSAGSIRGVEINELASALTTSNDKIYGKAEIPNYTLRFAGKTADEMKNSLTGNAKLSVTQGRIAALDLLSSIQQATGKLQGTPPGGGATNFASFTTNVTVGQSRMDLSDINLEGADLKVTGKGQIGFDDSLNFDLSAAVSGGVGGMVNALTRRDSGAATTIPVQVTGTIESPHVRPNVGKIAGGAVQGVLDSLFKKNK